MRYSARQVGDYWYVWDSSLSMEVSEPFVNYETAIKYALIEQRGTRVSVAQ